MDGLVDVIASSVQLLLAGGAREETVCVGSIACKGIDDGKAAHVSRI